MNTTELDKVINRIDWFIRVTKMEVAMGDARDDISL